MKRIANKNAMHYVTNKLDFKGSNTKGININENLYVVYSYGEHFPIFVNVNGEWFLNKDRYSVSTSKHQSQLHPLFKIKEENCLTTNELITKINNESRNYSS